MKSTSSFTRIHGFGYLYGRESVYSLFYGNGTLFIALSLPRLNTTQPCFFESGFDSSSTKAVSEVSQVLVPDPVGHIRLSDIHMRTFTIHRIGGRLKIRVMNNKTLHFSTWLPKPFLPLTACLR